MLTSRISRANGTCGFTRLNTYPCAGFHMQNSDKIMTDNPWSGEGVGGSQQLLCQDLSKPPVHIFVFVPNNKMPRVRLVSCCSLAPGLQTTPHIWLKGKEAPSTAGKKKDKAQGAEFPLVYHPPSSQSPFPSASSQNLTGTIRPHGALLYTLHLQQTAWQLWRETLLWQTHKLHMYTDFLIEKLMSNTIHVNVTKYGSRPLWR